MRTTPLLCTSLTSCADSRYLPRIHLSQDPKEPHYRLQAQIKPRSVDKLESSRRVVKLDPKPTSLLGEPDETYSFERGSANKTSQASQGFGVPLDGFGASLNDIKLKVMSGQAWLR